MTGNPRGDELRVFLEALGNSEPGSVVLSNIAGALDHVRAEAAANCELAAALRAALAAAARDFAERPRSARADLAAEAKHAVEVFLDLVEKEHAACLFKRRPQPEAAHPITLILRDSFFTHERSCPFTDDYRRNAPRDREAFEFDGARRVARFVRLGLRRALRPEARIGRPNRAVFVTRSDAGWLAEMRRCCEAPEEARKADWVRDLLGLPHDRDALLFELRWTCSLAELAGECRLQVAAPTVFEGHDHKYFRHCDGRSDGNWGRTLHLGALVDNEPAPQGAPEAVLDHIPLGRLDAATLKVEVVGKVTRSPPPQARYVAYLYRERSIEETIAAVLRDGGAEQAAHG
jgi:hypothetical protein